MRNRRVAEQRADPYLGRTLGSLARSPAERLEPTRPPAGARRGRSEREPRRMNPLLRTISGLLTFTLLLLLLLGGLALLFNSSVDAPGPLGQSKVVVIPKGEGAHEIGARLEREGVIGDRRLFIAAVLWSKFAAWRDGGKPPQLRAGDYAIAEGASIRQVVALLSEGKTQTYRVTVPEGLTSYQIVERLKADPNLTGDIAEVPAEGTLLPDTFAVERGAARQSVIDGMAAQLRRLMERAWSQRKKELPLRSWEDAVILASIVEKETGRNDERERVAAVFVNRLKHNMRLQSDPTILYGLAAGKVAWNRAIQKNEILQKTSYNTYQIDGLPPTPICNPGRAAITAVLNFADTKDLYFVADGAGGHVFAETLKDHNANVAKWRAHEKDARKAAPLSPALDAAVAPGAAAAPKAGAGAKSPPARLTLPTKGSEKPQ
jgi:UPF0755 protein